MKKNRTDTILGCLSLAAILIVPGLFDAPEYHHPHQFSRDEIRAMVAAANHNAMANISSYNGKMTRLARRQK